MVVLCAFAGAQDVPSSPVGPGERKVVRIRFEGNRRYTDEFLKEQIATKEGQAYDSGLIARDEEVLRQYFATVTDTIEKEVEGGVEITFVVLDKVVVGAVVIQGLARVRRDDIDPLLATKAGRPLLEHSLESDRQMIERLHRQKGYRFVDVHVYRQPTRKPDVENVVFQVIPGSRVKVREVILDGAHSLDRDDILQVVRNSDLYRKKYLGLGRIFSPRYYDRALIDQDRRRMELYYEREGYLDAKVAYVDTRFDEERSYAIIRYRVEEGPRYRVRSFKVEFAEDGLPAEEDRAYLAPAALETLSLLEFQQPYRLEDLANTRRQIVNRLWERAYARSSINEQITKDAEAHLVDIRLIVSAGPKVRLGRLRIFGNRYTRDNVVRRQFRDGALPGDFLDAEELESARVRLFQTRYFSLVRYGDGLDPLGLVRDPASPEPDIWDVDLEVEEADTRQFTFGAGISTDGGAFAQFSITWRNFDIKKLPDSPFGVLDVEAFRGGGQTFSINAAPGTVYSSYGISFSDPALRDSHWSLATGLSRRIALFDEYTQTTDGGNIRVGRFLDRALVWHFALEWTLRNVRISDPESDAPVNALDQQGRSLEHGLTFIFRRAKRRDVDAFLNGHVSTFSTTIFGGPFGADVDVVKVQFEHRAGWRVLKTAGGGWHRLGVIVSVDWATAFDGTPEVPIFERYFLGGRNLRGFEYRGVGPRSNGSPQGGEFMTTWSTQYTVPLTTREASGFSLDLVFFLDQGNLVVDPDDFSFNEWRMSAGFGFAIGFGGPTQPPLIIDFGFPIRSEDGDKRQLISVAFERNF